ncbi:protein kintoun [Hetaerina americana]|uniref:protein kintoun n=1 Tax=Hetaerina americana TaxID=62018 RepID=UPI003A7F1F89
MARKISSRLEDLDMSQDELNRLGEALKKEEFRELLFQYAREINDPENKKLYEEEITQLENERGVDIKFVHPEPQYVLKTCFNPGGEKVFLNICSNSLVGKPSMKHSHDSKGTSGVNWSIPLIQAPPREDLDKSGFMCTVYDVLFHPDTHALAAKDKRFRTFLEDTSLNAVEETFSVKLDRNSVKRPRMKFKGIPKPTVIRTRMPESNSVKEDDENFINQLPYPYSMPPKEPPCARELKIKNSEGPEAERNLKQSYVTPKYVLKQSSDIDMSNYEQNHLSHHDVTIPQRFVLVVDLPHIKSSSELELDVEEQKLSLVSIGKRQYKLDLKLSYPVQETKGNAKFDQEAGKLIVTLIVDREKALLKKYHLPEGDSGVESDICCGRVSSGEEEGVVEGSTVVAPERQIEIEAISAKSLEIEIGSDTKLADSMCSYTVSESDVLMQLEENEILEGSEDIMSKALEEEMPPNAVHAVEFFENSPVPSNEGNECSNTTENDMKCNVITQGLLVPEAQYTVPSYSCSCVQEAENMIITFVLHVKNVDPSSVMKKAFSIPRTSVDTNKQKSLEAVVQDDISLAPEKGSVCNDYRTLVESDHQLCALTMINARINSNEGMKENSGQAAHSPVISCEELILPPTSDPSKKSSLTCDISKFLSEGEMQVNGAKISIVNDVVENKLSDKFRDSMVITGGDVAAKFQADCDSFRCCKEITCFHVTFSSIGAGFFPQEFAFCVGFPSLLWPFTDFQSDDALPVSVEVWDNNVEMQLKKSSFNSDAVKEIDCFIGRDPSSMVPYQLPSFEEKLIESESFSDPEFSSLTSVSEDFREEGTKGESDSSGIGKENHEYPIRTALLASGKRKIFKERTLSESSVESITTKQAKKGILKRCGRDTLSRSLSESSGGEEYSWIGSAQHLSLSSSITSLPSLTEISRIPLGESLKEEAEEYDEEEEYDDEDGEKVKKIVRFSDVISKKTYRSNASILGQRKKNQRKLNNKKRAAERRASESENSIDEVDSSEKTNVDSVSDLSPPQKNENVLPNSVSTMVESGGTQSGKGKLKGSSKKKGNGNKGKGKKVIEPPISDDSSGNPSSPQYEFKSDLIFQLEL